MRICRHRQEAHGTRSEGPVAGTSHDPAPCFFERSHELCRHQACNGECPTPCAHSVSQCVVRDKVAGHLHYLEPYITTSLLAAIKVACQGILITYMGDQPPDNFWWCGCIAVWYQVVVRHCIMIGSMWQLFCPDTVHPPPADWIPLCLILIANKIRESEDGRVSNRSGGAVWNCGLIDPFAVALSQPSPDLSSLLATLKGQIDELHYPVVRILHGVSMTKFGLS